MYVRICLYYTKVSCINNAIFYYEISGVGFVVHKYLNFLGRVPRISIVENVESQNFIED